MYCPSGVKMTPCWFFPPRASPTLVAVAPCTAMDSRNARYAYAPLVGQPVGLALFHFTSLPLLPFGLPLRAEAWHPERAPRSYA